MATTVTAQDNSPSVVVSESGGRGKPGRDGTDGSGFNQVSLTKLNNALFQGFQPNRLVTASAPNGDETDVIHTRASTATYIDRYGVLKTAGIDELRETADGYQIEAVGSTNLLLDSDTPTTQVVNITSGDFTLWMEGSGTLTTVYGTSDEATPLTFNSVGELLTVTVVGSVDLFQLEKGNKSSYIPTTDAPATRAPDLVHMAYENNAPRGDQPYTIIFKGIVDGYTNFNNIFSIENNGVTYRITSLINETGNIFHSNGSDSSVAGTIDTITFGEEFTYVITSDGVNYTSYLDGVLQATSLVTTPATELPSELRVFRGTSGSTYSNGTVSLFKTLPYAINADEAKLIS